MRNRFNEEFNIFSLPPEVSYLIVEDCIQRALALAPSLRGRADIEHNIYSISCAVIILHEAQLLDTIDLNQITAHINPSNLAEALVVINEAGIHESFRSYILAHPAPLPVAEAFEFLDKFGLLNSRHCELLVQSGIPKTLALALHALHLNQMHLPQGLAIELVDELAKLVLTLVNANLLTHENLNTLRAKTQGFLIHANTLFSYISESGFLNQANFDLVMNLGLMKVDYLSNAFMFLFHRGLSNQRNFDAILKVNSLAALCCAICKMNFARVLTQENLDLLTHPAHAVLLSLQAQEMIWYHIPDNLLNQDVFNLLIAATTQTDPFEHFQAIMAQVLEMNEAHIVFNVEQSTHTASVHQSVSKSAMALHQFYGLDFCMNELKERIRDFSLMLEETNLHQQAAKRCMIRLLEHSYTFADPSSGLNLHELLGLVFLAIHDDHQRLGCFEDAKTLFIEALYEIQRGYNIDEYGIDMGGEDKPICAAGSFNKLIEKLVGVHPLCEIIYITPQTAALKLQQVILKEASDYLKSLASPQTIDEALGFLGLMHALGQDGVSVIWPHIKDQITNTMYAHFGELDTLHEIIEGGQYSDFSQLEHFQSQFQTSPGYQQLIYRMINKSNRLSLELMGHSFWVNRHDSAHAQRVFDRQFGLVLMR